MLGLMSWFQSFRAARLSATERCILCPSPGTFMLEGGDFGRQEARDSKLGVWAKLVRVQHLRRSRSEMPRS